MLKHDWLIERGLQADYEYLHTYLFGAIVLSLISCWLQLCAYNVYRECSHPNLSKQACEEVSQILKLTFLSNGD